MRLLVMFISCAFCSPHCALKLWKANCSSLSFFVQVGNILSTRAQETASGLCSSLSAPPAPPALTLDIEPVMRTVRTMNFIECIREYITVLVTMTGWRLPTEVYLKYWCFCPAVPETNQAKHDYIDSSFHLSYLWISLMQLRNAMICKFQFSKILISKG